MMLGRVIAAEAEPVVGFDHLQPRLEHLLQRLAVRVDVIENAEFHARLVP